MLVINKIGQGDIAKVVLRKSRVEIVMIDGTSVNYYVSEAYDANDELSVFATMMRNKFLDGRDRHQAQGSRVYHADTIFELQGELLDHAAYSAILWNELERLKPEYKRLVEEKR